MILFVITFGATAVYAVVSGIDANHRDGDWAFPWQGTLLALGLAQLALLVALIATGVNVGLALLFGLLALTNAILPTIYWMQADNHPRERKPFQPDRFPTGRG